MAEACAMIGSQRREFKYLLWESSTTTHLWFECKWLYADCFFLFFFCHRGREEREPLLSSHLPPAAFLWQRLTQTHRRHVSSDFLMSATDGLCHARLIVIMGRRKKKRPCRSLKQSLPRNQTLFCTVQTLYKVCVVQVYSCSVASIFCVNMCSCFQVGSLCCDESVWR